MIELAVMGLAVAIILDAISVRCHIIMIRRLTKRVEALEAKTP